MTRDVTSVTGSWPKSRPVTRPSLTLRRISEAVGGEIVGNQVLAPGPGRRPEDRSLSIRLSDRNDEGFFTMSRAGDDWRDCRDMVRARLGLPARADSPGEVYERDALRQSRVTAMDLDDERDRRLAMNR